MGTEPQLRPEVLACQKAADEATVAAEFWAGLVDHGHGDEGGCDEPDCYEAWREYPDG